LSGEDVCEDVCEGAVEKSSVISMIEYEDDDKMCLANDELSEMLGEYGKVNAGLVVGEELCEVVGEGLCDELGDEGSEVVSVIGKEKMILRPY
jgi:actin-like ATPase involved in cell morphogenesis